MSEMAVGTSPEAETIQTSTTCNVIETLRSFFCYTEISHEGDEEEEMPELQTVWAQSQKQSRQVLSAMFQRDGAVVCAGAQ